VKPSEKCKQAGLSGLLELSSLSGVSEQTLINWNKNKPDLFKLLIQGAVSLKK